MEGPGNRMSLYGKSYLSPEAKAGLWKNVLSRYERIRSRHLAIKGDGSKYFPGEIRMTPAELEELKCTYYGPRTRQTMVYVEDSIYDRLHYPKNGFDCKLHRDDRKQVIEIGKAVQEEEMKRLLPVQSSSEYGRRLYAPLEPFDRKRARIDHVLKGFYYKRGTGLPPIQD